MILNQISITFPRQTNTFGPPVFIYLGNCLGVWRRFSQLHKQRAEKGAWAEERSESHFGFLLRTLHNKKTLLEKDFWKIFESKIQNA